MAGAVEFGRDDSTPVDQRSDHAVEQVGRVGPAGWLAWGTALVLYTLVSFALFHVVPAWSVPQLAAHGHDTLATTPGLISIIAPKALGLIIDAVVVVIIAKTVAPEMLDCSRYLFAWSQDRLVPQAFLHTNRFRAPDVALLVSAILGSVFLVEATLYGFEIGVVIRSMSLVLVFGVLGVGILNLRFNPRMAELPWLVRSAGASTWSSPPWRALSLPSRWRRASWSCPASRSGCSPVCKP